MAHVDFRILGPIWTNFKAGKALKKAAGLDDE
jgi:hypothetical protein